MDYRLRRSSAVENLLSLPLPPPPTTTAANPSTELRRASELALGMPSVTAAPTAAGPRETQSCRDPALRRRRRRRPSLGCVAAQERLPAGAHLTLRE